MQHYHKQELRKKINVHPLDQGNLDYFIISRILLIFFYKKTLPNRVWDLDSVVLNDVLLPVGLYSIWNPVFAPTQSD